MQQRTTFTDNIHLSSRVGIALALALGAAVLQGFGQSSHPSTPSQAAPNSQQSQSSSASPSNGSPTLRKGAAPAPAAQQITPAEAKAFNAIQKEIDPNKQLQLAKSFLKSFPHSPLLTAVLGYMAGDEEEKNDVLDALNYGEQSLELQPNNLRSLILVADLLPQPQAMALQSTVALKKQQISQAEDDANRALQLVNELKPGPNFSQLQVSHAKTVLTSQLHAALGMAHLQMALLAPKTPGTADPTELAAAEKEFKTAVAVPNPNSEDYFRLGEVYIRENKLDDAISAFSQAAQLGKGTLIEKLSDQMIAKLKAAEAKNPPPAQPKQ